MNFGKVAVLLGGKVTSVYYTALPAVAAMLAVWCMLPRTTRRRAPVRAFVSLVVALNLALAATYFTYRHDWLARNQQLVDWLESHGERGPVFVCLKVVSSGEQTRDYSRLHGAPVRQAFRDSLRTA